MVRSVLDNQLGWECLLPLGSSGGLLVVWDTKVTSKVNVLMGCFSLLVFLDIKGRGCWWGTIAYGLTNPRVRNLLWKELFYVHGLCCPHWYVGAILKLFASLNIS